MKVLVALHGHDAVPHQNLLLRLLGRLGLYGTVALAKAFDTDVNGLPLSSVLSWYEQKAVVVLLTLLYLGIQGIRLGPSLPAFVTPAVLNVLVDKFHIAPTTTPAQDLQTLFG